MSAPFRYRLHVVRSGLTVTYSFRTLAAASRIWDHFVRAEGVTPSALRIQEIGE